MLVFKVPQSQTLWR